jgi:hypothetical protein
MSGLVGYASSDEEDDAQEEVIDVSVQYINARKGQDHY